MKILGLAGSNSATSINKQLVKYSLSKVKGQDIEILDLNDFEVPIYSPERETASGIPDLIQSLAEKINDADLIVISLAEHNGSYSAAFKNIYDWVSRIPNRKVWNDTNMILMAASPGGRGGLGVLEIALSRFPRDGANILGQFSLPNFYDNFNLDTGIKNTELENSLIKLMKF